MEIESKNESMESMQVMEDKPETDPVQEKPKKVLSEDRLQKLARARERASQVAREKRDRKKQMPVESTASGDPVVVVEQSESDEDQLEGPPGIIFVRRKRSKKAATPEAAPVNHEMNYLFASMFGPTKSTY